jgi:pimeloyl-ACP methyl ester carboxylesterase
MKRTGDVQITPTDLAVVTCPVLVVVGTDDFVYPSDELAESFPNGRCVELPKVDHFATPESFGFFDAALEFLDAI